MLHTALSSLVLLLIWMANSPTVLAQATMSQAAGGSSLRIMLGKPTRALPHFKIEAKHQALRSSDARCAVSVTYPQIQGLADRNTEAGINRFLYAAFKPAQVHNVKLNTRECDKGYSASVGFASTLIGSGVLSVKRSRIVESDGGNKTTASQQCYAIDLKRGGVVDLSRELSSEELATLSSLASSAISTRYRSLDLRRLGAAQSTLTLTAGSFSICLMDDHLVIPIEAPHLTAPATQAVEAIITYDNLIKNLPNSMLARRIGASSRQQASQSKLRPSSPPESRAFRSFADAAH